eukprot:CAMPEP_0173310032 /NCGR_PEP_ID=MMETSP1143-20121109/22663_1 /TAXON_ID=483371 /ORGANISM="non described non described, Strain CCMP2298" /LENGTH=51 /DNA_ID=CAMNT_0014251695 /DNA_START=21 /DNA_END=176 /DNA_ORIENTATION=+
MPPRCLCLLPMPAPKIWQKCLQQQLCGGRLCVSAPQQQRVEGDAGGEEDEG